MWRVLNFVVLFFVFNSAVVSFEDGFIVDDGGSSSHVQQAISKIKSVSSKPVVRSMAMSSVMTSMGRKNNITRNETSEVHLNSGAKMASKHIEPSISLEQSLKNLDLASKREEIQTAKKHEGNKEASHLTNDSSLSILPIKANATRSLEGAKKKSASPNVLTNATITGFLSNNPKFTIDSVGQNNNKDSDAKKKKESKRKSRKTIITSRDTVAKVNGDHQILRIANDPMIAANNKDSLSALVHNTNINSNKIESSSSSTTDSARRSNNKNEEILNKTESSSTVASTRSNNKESLVSSNKPNIHVATEEDFNKLRYIKRKEIEENAVKKEIVSTHHEAECNEEKKCPKNKYCRSFHCFEAHRKHHECDENDECADEMPCIYGRCDDKPKASPGAICDKDGDCGDGCCVIEPTIDERHGTCKNKLEEFHQCSPVLFRKVWIGDEKPECGPCADGLECVERGIHSSHLVCMKKK